VPDLRLEQAREDAAVRHHRDALLRPRGQPRGQPIERRHLLAVRLGGRPPLLRLDARVQVGGPPRRPRVRGDSGLEVGLGHPLRARLALWQRAALGVVRVLHLLERRVGNDRHGQRVEGDERRLEGARDRAGRATRCLAQRTASMGPVSTTLP
jgi:hypothetical protein